MTDLCQICEKQEADFEGVICWGCKMEQDRLNRREELRAYGQDMLEYSHKGEWCWLTGQGKIFCQEGRCEVCVLYCEWRDAVSKS